MPWLPSAARCSTRLTTRSVCGEGRAAMGTWSHNATGCGDIRDRVTMPTMKDLRGKVAVVTGGAGGIGRAMGRRFGQEGMKVVLADVLAEPLDEATRALADEGVDAIGVVTDVTDYSSVEVLAKETLDRFGAIHVVCNNAGTGAVSEGYIWDHDLADWRWGIDVNVLGVIHGIKAFVP